MVERFTDESCSSGRDSGPFDSVVERALELGPGSAERGFAGDVVGESWVQLGDPRVVLVNKTAIKRPWSVSS